MIFALCACVHFCNYCELHVEAFLGVKNIWLFIASVYQMCDVSSLQDSRVYLRSFHLQDERPSLQSSNACYTCIGAPVRDMLPNFGRL